MRCGPALIAIASVLMFIPFGELSLMRGSMASSSLRSPFTEISIFSSLAVLPNIWPVGVECSITRNAYMPSAGKLWTTEMPPRVPIGAPSTRCNCDEVRGTLYVVCVGDAVRSPSASRLILRAARM